MKKGIKRTSALLAAIFLLFMTALALPVSAAESPGAAIVGEESFENLSGSGKYLAKAYRDNYEMDTEELGFMDAIEKIGKNLSNMLFSMCTKIAYMGVQVFHFAMQFDLVDLVGDGLETIQTALKVSIFDALFLLAFLGVAISMVRHFYSRNLQGLATEVAKALLIVLLANILSLHSGTILSTITGVSRNIGMSVIMGINGEAPGSNPERYAAQTAGVLWNDLVHQPWLSLEFYNGSAAEEEVDAILGKTPESEERQEAVNHYIQVHPGALNKTLGWKRLGYVLIYLILLLVKLLVYVVCALSAIVFQLLAVFYLLMGPVMLVLSMFETFGGLRLLVSWGKKILETQIMVLVTMALLGLLLWFAELMRFADTSLGWMGSMMAQGAVIVIVFLNRNRLLKGVQQIANNPRALPMRVQHMSLPSTTGRIAQEYQIRKDRKQMLADMEVSRQIRVQERIRAEKQSGLVDQQSEILQLRKERLANTMEYEEKQRAAALEQAAAQEEQTQKRRQRPTTVHAVKQAPKDQAIYTSLQKKEGPARPTTHIQIKAGPVTKTDQAYSDGLPADKEAALTNTQLGLQTHSIDQSDRQLMEASVGQAEPKQTPRPQVAVLAVHPAASEQTAPSPEQAALQGPFKDDVSRDATAPQNAVPRPQTAPAKPETPTTAAVSAPLASGTATDAATAKPKAAAAPEKSTQRAARPRRRTEVQGQQTALARARQRAAAEPAEGKAIVPTKDLSYSTAAPSQRPPIADRPKTGQPVEAEMKTTQPIGSEGKPARSAEVSPAAQAPPSPPATRKTKTKGSGRRHFTNKGAKK